MLRFRDLVRPGAETVAGLEAAVARASAAATDASARLEKLQAERRAALVADDDARCDRLDAEITTATRDRERALEAGLELGARLSQARQRERQAKVDAVFERGEAARAKAVSVTRNAYAKAARAIVAAAAEIEAAGVVIAECNLGLAQAGDERRIGDPDLEARPVSTPQILPLPIPPALVVPDPSDASRMLWPAGDVLSARYVHPAQRGLDRALGSTPGVPREVVSIKRPADAA